MDEKDLREIAVHLTEVDARSKSNAHRLDGHDKEIKEIREKQDAIYELTSSVKSIATDMTYIKEDVQEVKSGQKELTKKVNEIENRPANESHKRLNDIKDKIIWIVIGGIVTTILYSLLPNIKF